MKRDIKVYNRKIAKFVGASIQQCKTINTYKWVFNANGYNPFKAKFNDRLVLQDLHFHDDWNWAIEVLRLIEKHGCVVEVSICLATMCRICVIGPKHEKPINIIYDDNDDDEAITPIYNAICDYIDYYEKKIK